MDWRAITIDGANETFLISITNASNDNFLFSMTDFKELWREKISWQEILCRAKSDNPIMNVDGEESAIERTIFSLANQYQRNVNDDNEMILKTKYYIGGVPFHFQWKLTKANGDVFYDEITRKLLVSLLNVKEQRNELFQTIQRKDIEIGQYKIEGATLMRRQIETQAFIQSDFDRKFELISGSSLFSGNDNNNTIKKMCNYADLIKDNSTKTSNVTGPSPSKISKSSKNKEEVAMRKFKAKKECKIQYQSSCELLDSDDDKESKSESDARNNAIIDSKMDQQKEAPKRKIKTKLNL